MGVGLTDIEIIKEIKRLPLSKKFLIVEETLKEIKRAEIYSQMELGANLLMEDYSADNDLIAFTKIDFDSFYETK